VIKSFNNSESNQRILETKQKTISDELHRNFPDEFKQYFNYCLSLKFEDTPDYSYLRKLFRDLFIRSNYLDDGIYDWDIMPLNT